MTATTARRHRERVHGAEESSPGVELNAQAASQPPGDGTDSGSTFIAMEFVRGETLRAWLKRKSPHWAAIVATYSQAGRGLAAAHAVGLVHRDFKPDNAMLGSDGRVRVLGFGLARVGEGPTATGRRRQRDRGSARLRG